MVDMGDVKELTLKFAADTVSGIKAIYLIMRELSMSTLHLWKRLTVNAFVIELGGYFGYFLEMLPRMLG
jgi:hypothetical protein